MNKIELPYFEDIDPKHLEDEYDTEVEYDHRNIVIFLNEMSTVDKKRINVISNVLKDLPGYDEQNLLFIKNEFNDTENENMVRNYLTFHLEVLNATLDEETDALEEEMDNPTPKKEDMEALLEQLHLSYISFYADDIIFDYSLDDGISDEILSVVLNKDQNRSISWES